MSQTAPAVSQFSTSLCLLAVSQMSSVAFALYSMLDKFYLPQSAAGYVSEQISKIKASEYFTVKPVNSIMSQVKNATVVQKFLKLCL